MNRKKRIIAKAIFAVLTAVMLFACKSEGEKVTGVVLDHRELKADIGQTVTLTATVLPAEVADPKVSWEAVPKGIVELTPDGALCTVKAVKDGAAVVTVTTEDGGFVTTCAVTVLPVPAESVTLDRETVSLVLGNKDTETATLTATVFPENATDKTVIWSAEPENIVELTDGKDGRCTVKALKDGTVTVTATAVDGGFTATCTVTTLRILPESVALDNDELKLIFGDPAADTATLTATVFPENAANKTVRWSIGRTDCIDLIDHKDGRCTIRALKAGNVTVTATAEDGGKTATCTVTVVPVAAESVVLDRETLSVMAGKTATLTAAVFPENAANKTVIWSAEPADTVSLTDNGNGRCTLKALKAGETVVTATAVDGGHVAKCTVTVTPVRAERVELNFDAVRLMLENPESETATLTATVFPDNAPNKTVRWSVGKAGFIELTDNGNGRCTVKALKVGEVTVTATAEDGGHTATCTITVVPISVESVRLDWNDLNLILGNKSSETETLTATVFPENAPNKAVSWSVEPENIVGLTVGEDSRCTIRALNVGHAVVTVTAEDGGETASCRVTVSPTYAESIALNREKVDLLLSSEGGETETLTATVSPKNTTNKTVIWSAEPADAVKLTDNGNGSCTVEALKLGAVAVTATAADGSGHTATCTVTVSPVTAESVTLDRDNVDLILSSEGGETATLTATVSPENTLNKTIIWSAEPEDAVKLTDNGNGSCTVEALKVGEIVVTAIAEDGGHTATCTVTVAPVAAESIELDRDELKLVYGDSTAGTATLTATVFPGNALDKTVRWTASPEGVVALHDNGDGSCTVTALGGESATVTAVSVANPAVKAASRISVDYPYLTNTALIEAIDTRGRDSAGNWISVGWTKESDGTVKLTPENLQKIRAVTELKITEASLSDLGGIEYFTGLTYLNCSNNNLSELDVTKNTALTYLYCDSNNMTTLDVTNNTALTELDCSSNNLTTLDVTKNTALTELDCSSNNLTTLDVTKNTALTYLDCGSNNNLTTLDVTKNTALKTLYCRYNDLTTLDVTKNTALKTLYCSYNRLTTLDVTKNTALTYLYCYSNNMTTLNVSGCTALTELYCQRNDLTTLDVSGCTALRSLNFSKNNLTTLDVSGTALTELDCGNNNNLTTLDASGCTKLYQLLGDMTGLRKLDVSGTALETLDFTGNELLTTLDASGCTVLTTLKIEYVPLSILNVSGCTALETLDCSNNKLLTTLDASGCTVLTTLDVAYYYGDGNLTTLNVSGCTALTTLNCHNRNLTTLDVSGCTALTRLSFFETYKLTTLDASGCTALTELDCSSNNLTTLDVSGCTALTELYCYSNNLTTLDVSGCTELTKLSCYSNNLTTLDVSGCTELTKLSCYSNNLTTLDLSKNTRLWNLDCSYNGLTTLDVSKNTALTELNCSRNDLTTLDLSKNTRLWNLDCSYNGLTTLDIRSLSQLSSLFCTPQRKNPDWSIRQLTLKLTRDQKSQFELNESSDLKLEVYNYN